MNDCRNSVLASATSSADHGNGNWNRNSQSRCPPTATCPPMWATSLASESVRARIQTGLKFRDASFSSSSWTALRVLAASVPDTFKSFFPTGASVTSDRYGLTAEAQLPTRIFTLLLKAYNGEDLRFYFVGGLFSNFNDIFGLTGTASTTSIDGSSTVVFGINGSGEHVIAPQRPVRTRGGSVDLAFPLSRIFGANPDGRNAGWVLNFFHAYDDALARDVRRIGAANRSRDDMFAGTLSCKLNKYLGVSYEESYYRTRAANRGGPLPLYRGIHSYQWHDLRHQLAVQVTF